MVSFLCCTRSGISMSYTQIAVVIIIILAECRTAVSSPRSFCCFFPFFLFRCTPFFLGRSVFRVYISLVCPSSTFSRKKNRRRERFRGFLRTRRLVVEAAAGDSTHAHNTSSRRAGTLTRRHARIQSSLQTRFPHQKDGELRIARQTRTRRHSRRGGGFTLTTTQHHRGSCGGGGLSILIAHQPIFIVRKRLTTTTTRPPPAASTTATLLHHHHHHNTTTAATAHRHQRHDG